MNLETKRNAIMNSVSSSGGGIELLDTITVTEPMAKIDIEVDTSQYGTFFIVGDFNFNQASNNWIYFGVNGGYPYYFNFSVPLTISIPNATNFLVPIIITRTTDDYIVFNYSAVNSIVGTKINTSFSNVTHITLGTYSSSRYDVGTKLYLYGMRKSLTDIGE